MKMARETINIAQTRTVDATPATVIVRAMEPNSAMTMRYSAVARSSANVVKAWNGVRTIQRSGTDAPAPVGTAIAPDIDPSASAPAWTIAAGASGNSVILTLTGAAATTIDWDISIDAVVNVFP
jgi:hypothetical protein